MKKRLLFLLLTGVLSLSGCGKKKQETPPGGTVSGVSLSESALNVQKGKRSEDVTVTIAGEGDFNKNVKLSSDNEAVATTSFTEVASGEAFKVYGHSIGTATISVVSVQDESKAASLSVTVYEKQALPVDPEISSFYLDKTTKAFELGTEETYAEFQLTVTGKGEFDKSAAISVKYMDLEGKDDAEHPCVSLDKTSVSSGEKFRVTRSDTQTGTAEITLTSKQDATKTATLQVRVSPHNEPQTDITEDVRLDYSSRTILIDDTFIVRSTAIGGDISWKLREKDSEVLADTSTYLEIVEANNDGATVRGLAEVDEINLVATVGEHKAECKFTVSEAPSDVRELYVTNNSALNYDEIYFYAWNDKDQHNADWPGVKLTEHIENTNYELCYKFSVDILKYPNYKFNNGKSGEELKETTNCTFEELGTYDNVYFREDGTYGYATIQKNVPSINFVNILNNTMKISAGGISENVTFRFNKGTPAYEEVDATDCIEVADFAAGSFKVSGKKAGTASVRIYLTEHPEVEATLTVQVLDTSEMMTLYFSNSLSWESVYIYMWGEDGNNGWPGERLYNPVKNKEGQDVYVLHIPAEYNSFVMNNGRDGEGAQQSIDVSKNDSHFTGDINNIWLMDEQEVAGHYKVGFAKYEPFVYAISFGSPAVENAVTLDKDGRISVAVNATGSGVVYNIATGSDFVKIVSERDDRVVLEWLGAGEATLVATVGGVSATLTITCTNNQAARQDKTFIFSNNQEWEHVYFYAWGDGGNNAAWPGVELTSVLGQNKYGQDLYQFSVDAYLYDSFLLCEGESGRKTSDIHLADITDFSLNNIYVGDQVGDSNEYAPGFVEFHAIEPHEFTVNIEEGKTKQISVSSIFALNTITVESSDESKATASQIEDGKITITALAVGQTTVTLTHGVEPDQVVEEIEVHVVPENKVTYYFYNSYESFTNFSLYLFDSASDAHKSEWPGDAFTGETVKNAAGKECYSVVVDRNLYDSFILVANDPNEDNKQKQTDNIMFSEHVGKNMFAMATGDNAWHDIGENTWRARIEAGVYAPFVYSVAFNENDVTVYDSHDLTIGVTANGTGVNYEVTTGADKVSVVNAESNDHQVSLHFEAAGAAVVTATLNGATATLNVTASAEPVPVDNKTFVFTNNQEWEHVYVYAFGTGDVKNAEYPGVELTTSLGKNKYNQDLYEFTLDRNGYTGFIINEGSEGRKTSDIHFADIADFSLNNIYMGDQVGDSKAYTPGFVKFHAIEPDQFDVTVEVGKTLDLDVSSIYALNSITVASNDTSRATVTQISDGKITITGVAVGATTITLTHGEAPNQVVETINVTVAEENKVTYYFYNSYNNYTGLHLYLFNSSTQVAKSAFPGDELTGETVKNAAGKDCFAVEVDRNLYDSFILVAWENSEQKQTDDVAFDDYPSSNMFSFETENSPWHMSGGGDWKCTIKAETYATHVHSYDPSTHVCVCGEAELGYVNITFVVNFNTNGNGDIYMYGLGGWDDAHRVAMGWTDGNNWTVTLTLEQGEQITFKYVHVDAGGEKHWEGGSDRTYTPNENATYNVAWQA